MTKLVLKAFVKIAEKDRVQILEDFFEKDRRFWVSSRPEPGDEDFRGEEDYTAFEVWVYKGMESGVRLNVDNFGQIMLLKEWSKEEVGLLESQLETLIRELCTEVNNGSLTKLPELGETLIARALLTLD